jgi:hypothetical protein
LKKKFFHVEVTVQGSKSPIGDPRLASLITKVKQDAETTLREQAIALKVDECNEIETSLQVAKLMDKAKEEALRICPDCNDGHVFHATAVKQVIADLPRILSDVVAKVGALRLKSSEHSKRKRSHAHPESVLDILSPQSCTNTPPSLDGNRQPDDATGSPFGPSQTAPKAAETSPTTSISAAPSTDDGLKTKVSPSAEGDRAVDQELELNKPLFNNLSRVSVIPKYIQKQLSLGYKFCPPVDSGLIEHVKSFDTMIQKLQLQLSYNMRSNPRLRSRFDCIVKLERQHLIERLEDEKDHPEAIYNKRGMNDFLIKNDLIVKPADKNLGLTLMDFTWYHNQVLKHLNDSTTYRAVRSFKGFDESNLRKQLALICMKSGSSYKSDELVNKLLPKSSKGYVAPEFYVLPKIHKTPISTRPIVASHSAPTKNASVFVHEHLLPLVQEFEWVAERSLDSVRDLEELAFYHPPHKIWLVTADVETLYTNINTEEGIDTVSPIIEEKLKPNGKLIKHLLRWVLGNNYLRYGDTTYIQIKGTAMGTNLAPSYANLFVACKEKDLLKKYYVKYADQEKLGSLQILYYKRYIDDCFMIVLADSESELITLFNEFNSLSPSLKYKFEKSLTDAAFLDLYIFKGEKYARTLQFDFSLYEKPTNNHLFTHPSTYKPHHHKFGWLYGETVRIARNCSNEELYQMHILKFQEHLRARHYPYQEIIKQTQLAYEKRYLYMDVLPVDKKPADKKAFLVLENDGTRPALTKSARRIQQFLAPESTTPLVVCVKKGRSQQDHFNSCNKRTLKRQIPIVRPACSVTSSLKHSRENDDESPLPGSKSFDRNVESAKDASPHIAKGKEKAEA